MIRCYIQLNHSLTLPIYAFLLKYDINWADTKNHCRRTTVPVMPLWKFKITDLCSSPLLWEWLASCSSHCLDRCWPSVKWNLKNRNWILINTHQVLVQKCVWKVSSAKRRPFCSGLNILDIWDDSTFSSILLNLQACFVLIQIWWSSRSPSIKFYPIYWGRVNSPNTPSSTDNMAASGSCSHMCYNSYVMVQEETFAPDQTLSKNICTLCWHER